MKIFLDLDEVLADFVGGACQAWGVSREAVEAEWPAGEWDIVPPLGRVLKANDPTTDWGEDMFWRIISDMGEFFWSKLRPLPWMGEVIDLVRYHAGDDWLIVTSPSHCPTSYAGKARWVDRYLGRDGLRRLVLTTNKPAIGGPGAVLIDDREETVRRFEKVGGRGILFPRLHNSRHNERHDPLAAVIRDLAR